MTGIEITGLVCSVKVKGDYFSRRKALSILFVHPNSINCTHIIFPDNSKLNVDIFENDIAMLGFGKNVKATLFHLCDPALEPEWPEDMDDR